MSITAASVKDLRERTGAGMMDCKKALAENGGDVEAALDYLKKKGLAKAAKRQDREAREGLIAIEVEGDQAAIVEVNSETDFVARNEEFAAFVDETAKLALATNSTTPEALGEQSLASGATVSDRLSELVGKIGEKMTLSRCDLVQLQGAGVIEPYLHPNGSVGVLVVLGADSEEVAAKPEFRAIAHDLALHIAFADPIGITRDAVPEDVIERERKISRERALEEGKPEQIVDKIVDGQINKYMKDIVLLDQAFVKDDKLSVEKWMEQEAKAAGGKATVQAFIRYKRGDAGGTTSDGDQD